MPPTLRIHPAAILPALLLLLATGCDGHFSNQPPVKTRADALREARSSGNPPAARQAENQPGTPEAEPYADGPVTAEELYNDPQAYERALQENQELMNSPAYRRAVEDFRRKQLLNQGRSPASVPREFPRDEPAVRPHPNAAPRPPTQARPPAERAPTVLDDGWLRVYGDGGSYSAELAGEPEALDQQIGGLRLRGYSYATSKTRCDLGHLEYPDLGQRGFKADQVLDEVRGALANSAGWRIDREQRTKVNGFPARLLRCRSHYPDMGHVQMQVMMIIDRRRLYLVMTATGEGTTAAERAECARFRQSFRLHHSR